MSALFRGGALLLALGLAACATTIADPPPPLPPVPDPEQTRAKFADALTELEAAEADGRITARECEAISAAFRRSYHPGDPQSLPGLFNAGAIWERCDQPDRAAAIYGEVVSTALNKRTAPTHASAHNNLGVIKLRAGEHEQATAAFGRAVVADPKAPAPRNNFAAALRERYASEGADDDFVRAERSLQSALAVDSDNALAYENLARLYYDRGRRDRSYLLLADLVITQATRILEQQQRPSAELYNLRGLLLMEEGDQVSALRAFKRATELDPEHAEGHLNIAMIALRFRDYPTAETSLRKALEDEQHAKNISALLGLGLAQRGQRRYQEAAKTLRQASKVAPRDPRALYNLGILYHEHIAPTASQVPVEGGDDVKFDETPYRDAQNYFKKFGELAGKRYPDKVADARARMASIEQLLEDVRVLGDLQAEQDRLMKDAERQQQTERKRLLEVERRARKAHQGVADPM